MADAAAPPPKKLLGIKLQTLNSRRVAVASPYFLGPYHWGLASRRHASKTFTTYDAALRDSQLEPAWHRSLRKQSANDSVLVALAKS